MDEWHKMQGEVLSFQEYQSMICIISLRNLRHFTAWNASNYPVVCVKSLGEMMQMMRWGDFSHIILPLWRQENGARNVSWCLLEWLVKYWLAGDKPYKNIPLNHSFLELTRTYSTHTRNHSTGSIAFIRLLKSHHLSCEWCGLWLPLNPHHGLQWRKFGQIYHVNRRKVDAVQLCFCYQDCLKVRQLR